MTNTNKSSGNNISKCTLLLFIVIIVFILFIYSNNNNYKLLEPFTYTEPFVSARDIEGQTGNVVQTDGSCAKSNDAEYVAFNYEVCCSPESTNCMCHVSAIKKCASTFNTCFDGKVKHFEKIRKDKEDTIRKLEDNITNLKTQKQSITSMQQIKSKEKLLDTLKTSLNDEPKTPPGLMQTCQSEFKKCASTYKLANLPNPKYELTTMKKTDSGATAICELSNVSTDTIHKCINYCDSIAECKGGILNRISRSCTLYDKPLIEAEPGSASGDGAYLPFIPISTSNNNTNINIKEAFNSNSNSPRTAKQLLETIDNKHKNHNTCKNTVISDINQLKDIYTFQKLDDELPKIPDFENQICRMYNVPYSKCELECLTNESCQYFTITNDDNNNDNNSNTINNQLKSTPYNIQNTTCNLYSGFPLYDGDKLKLAKVNKHGNYYLKITRDINDVS